MVTIFTMIGVWVTGFVLVMAICIVFVILKDKWETWQDEKDMRQQTIDRLWSIANKHGEQLEELEKREPRGWTQDADLAQQLEAHANLNQEQFTAVTQRLSTLEGQSAKAIFDTSGLLRRENDRQKFVSGLDQRMREWETQSEQRFKEIKEEFVRVERRAGIMSKELADTDHKMRVLEARLNANNDVLVDHLEKTEKKVAALQNAVNKMAKEAHATQDNPTEREGSGVEHVVADEPVQEEPTGQGEEGGGASGYPPVNYRRDYPRA
jgi:chromosome segregation ATPase